MPGCKLPSMGMKTTRKKGSSFVVKTHCYLTRYIQNTFNNKFYTFSGRYILISGGLLHNERAEG